MMMTSGLVMELTCSRMGAMEELLTFIKRKESGDGDASMRSAISTFAKLACSTCFTKKNFNKRVPEGGSL